MKSLLFPPFFFPNHFSPTPIPFIFSPTNLFFSSPSFSQNRFSLYPPLSHLKYLLLFFPILFFPNHFSPTPIPFIFTPISSNQQPSVFPLDRIVISLVLCNCVGNGMLRNQGTCLYLRSLYIGKLRLNNSLILVSPAKSRMETLHRLCRYPMTHIKRARNIAATH
ncbi:uncharacterized protein LOC108463262 isoform X2 [Gossypium arboreum]|uniref:uncharacterized protein LOC108463262 isoform X2 n=1 Tax=Gossypium arboreum TaxID=29729 RepID=UPI0022F1DBDE|nr:uncharacterized protein LOC108463262 isoform X2 [Gossypium arboreum]